MCCTAILLKWQRMRSRMFERISVSGASGSRFDTQRTGAPALVPMAMIDFEDG